MKKILLAILCGGLLATPSMANATKHKRPHASKRVKKSKRAVRTTMASAQPQHSAPAAQPQHTAPAPAPQAPIVQQVRDDEAPRH